MSIDLSDCDREPIHIPGAVQAHGALVTLSDDELSVHQASANVAELLGAPLAQVLGVPLPRHLEPGEADQLRRAAALPEASAMNPLSLKLGGRAFEGLLHRHRGVLILELEPKDAPGPAAPGRLDAWVARLQAARAVGPLLEAVVAEVKRLTGFERVMVYRFHPDDHGSVEAEACDPPWEPYRGLHYPASDIPRPVRALYLENPLRVIADTRAEPVPLVPALRPDSGEPLDLSHSVLRAVSPVHVEYLANMGVRAAASAALEVGGRLWGLVSCLHHSGPRRLAYRARAELMTLTRLTALLMGALEDQQVASRRAARAGPLDTLAFAMGEADDVLLGLLTQPEPLLKLVRAAGAAVVREGNVAGTGATPAVQLVTAIAAGLDQGHGAMVAATDSIVARVPQALESPDLVSGVLSFALPGREGHRLLWFRPELPATVRWGGDPRKPLDAGARDRLHPRRSFAQWKEEVRLRSEPWTADDVEAAEDLRRLAVERDLEKQVQRGRRATRARDELLAAVSHDLKNPLSAMALEAEAVRRAMHTGGEAAARLAPRLARMQRTIERMNGMVKDLLELAQLEAGQLELSWQRVDARELAAEAAGELGALAEAAGITLTLSVSDEELELLGDRDRLLRVLSNLLGNALKFTPPSGHVTVEVGQLAGLIRVAVTDSGPGVPETLVPRLFDRYARGERGPREGAGLGLYIARGIIEAHGGRLWYERAPRGGARFSFTLPAAAPQRQGAPAGGGVW